MAYIALLLAGVAGGIVNAIAGGATLITFPAMLMAGIPPIVANASNAVAISPGHLMAAIADRQKLPRFDNGFVFLVLGAILGGGIGASFLMFLPESSFLKPVPLLIGFATLLFALAPRIQERVAKSGRQYHPDESSTLLRFLLFCVSVYGGFFGAGLGVLLSAILSIADPGDIRRVKVIKNSLASSVSLAAMVIFIARGMVQWSPTLVMLTGALIGGYLGGRMISILPGRTVRQFVVASGTCMTFYYAWKVWCYA